MISLQSRFVTEGYQMDNIAGPPVEGENFFGREQDVDRLWDLLTRHDILLLGPRRIGKTSVARAVMAQARANDWHAVEVNVASGSDERAFLDKLDQAIKQENATWATQALDSLGQAWNQFADRIRSLQIPVPGAGSLGIDLAPSEGEEDWTHLATAMLRLLIETEQSWLISIDELPILLYTLLRNDPQQGVARVRRFLDWFRNDVCNLPGASRVRWLVSGSVGLDTLVQQHGMADTINNLNHQGLAPFEATAALAMLDRLATRYQIPLTAEEGQRLVDAIRWLQPYYLQLAFTHLRTLIQLSGCSLQQGLEQALEKMIQPGTDNDFHHWKTRLSQQLAQEDARHALALLERAAQDPLGARPESLLAILEERLSHQAAEEVRAKFIQLRDILQRDAYWWPDDSSGSRRYRFCLEPLRRWWVRRNTL